MPRFRTLQPLPSGLASRPLIISALATLLVGLLAGFGLGRLTPLASATPTVVETAPTATVILDDFALLGEIEGLIREEYLRPDTAGQQALLYGAARGMIGALNDPNSVYETPQERQDGDSRWTGRYDGVGMFVDQREGEM